MCEEHELLNQLSPWLCMNTWHTTHHADKDRFYQAIFSAADNGYFFTRDSLSAAILLHQRITNDTADRITAINIIANRLEPAYEALQQISEP